MSDVVVGIDLGTSNSVITVVLEGEPIVIPDDEGNRIHPSVVHFQEDGSTITGNEALDYRIHDPSHTVYSVKRLIGRPFDNPDVKVMMGSYPYPIVAADDGSPRIELYNQLHPPEGISARILDHLRGLAEGYLGQAVDKAIITVPANFDEGQRRATKRSADLAGIDVLRLINEPTAAALAYGYGQNRRERIAIYDFGGGTFDISILELRNNVFQVVSTAGNSYLGGDDMDYRLVSMMLNAFERQHGYDLSGNETVQQRLKAVAQQIKHELTNRESVKARVTEYIPGTLTELDLEFTLTREAFNRRCDDIVEESLETCQEALEVAGVRRTEIDHLVMVGGSTRVPIVRRKVRSFFAMDPVLDINPDEVVSIGAAIFGSSIAEGRSAPEPAAPEPSAEETVDVGPDHVESAAQDFAGPSEDPDDDLLEPDDDLLGGEDDDLLASNDDEKWLDSDHLEEIEEEPANDGPLLIDVTPHALGVATVGGVMDVIIERNGSLPLERSRYFSTSRDNQTRVVLPIYAGNSRRTEENRELGELELTDIPPRPREQVQIEVTFSVNTDGMLSVSAMDTNTGNAQSAELSILGDAEDSFDDFDDFDDLELDDAEF